ncbi:MAG: hypothetical protein ACT4O5_08660 [Gammaproteobacteria bacterium]
MSRYLATIEERGNGFAGADEYVTEDGQVYRVVKTYGQIHTGQTGSGTPNYIHAVVEDADWSDVDDDSEPYCTAVVDTTRSVDPRDVCARLSEYDDGTGDLEIIVRQALKDDPAATDEDIIEIIEEARADAERERS